jgi:hypothetical protein
MTPMSNDSVYREAAGNLSFLLSVIRCGESLSEAEEANVRRVIHRLNVAEDADIERAKGYAPTKRYCPYCDVELIWRDGHWVHPPCKS